MHLHLQMLPSFQRGTRKFGLKKGLSALLTHRLLVSVGIGLFGVFVPVFYLELFQYKLESYLAFAITFYAIVFFLMPFGAKIMTRLGMRKAMVTGISLYALWFFILSLKGTLDASWIIVGGLVTGVFYSAIYWIPFHVEFTKTTSTRTRGRVLSCFNASLAVIGIFTPMIAGLSIARFGYNSIIWVSVVFFLLSIFPLYWIKPVKERYDFTYGETYRVLFSRPNRAFLWVYMIEGAEGIVGSLVWPLFLFYLMKGDYIGIGLNAGFIVAISTLLELLMGYLTDKRDDRRLLHVGIGLSSVGWVIKAFVVTVAQAVLAGVYHSFALIILRVPFQTMTYTRLAETGHYIDEYTVLREIALSLGRAAMLALCLFFFSSFGFSLGFMLAALATFGFNLVTRLDLPKFRSVQAAK